MSENKSLYFFEGIACFLVICIHAPMDGIFGSYIYLLALNAVPLFFAISGFSLYPYIGTPEFFKKLKKRFIRNLILTAVAMAVYIGEDIILGLTAGVSPLDTLKGYLSISKIVNFVFFNQLTFTNKGASAPHLWYMFALLYSYLALMLMGKLITKNNAKYFAYASAAAFIIFNAAGFILSLFPDICLFSPSYPLYYFFSVKCFYTRGVPFMLIGLFLGGFTCKKTFAFEKIRPLPIIFILLLTGLSLAAYKLTHYLLLTAYEAASPIILSCSLIFIYCKRDNMKDKNPIVLIGKCLSANIYLWHLLILKYLPYLMQNFPAVYNSSAYTYIRPILIFIPSAIVAAAIYFIKKLIKRREGKEKAEKTAAN